MTGEIEDLFSRHTETKLMRNGRVEIHCKRGLWGVSAASKEEALREALVLIGCRQIYMLIPKKRGSGYLKQPLGHHACPLSELAYQIGFDMYGLDGHLEICTGYIAGDNHQYFIDRAVEPICNLLGCEYRLVNDREFFASHPVQTNHVY